MASAAAKPRVLVLGGGYAALTVTRKLRRAIRSGRIDCTVVTGENFHAFHGYIGEMLTGRVSASHILSPARRIFDPARVHVARAERVDLDSRTVTTSRRLDGRRQTLDYDQLVICLGSEDRTDVYPGLAEHAFRLKAYADCFRLRNHIITMLELAAIETDPEERRRLLTFFVAGGGFAGTEVAGELADLLRRLTKREYSEIDLAECRVVLVEPGPTIVPELYGKGGEGPGAHPRLVEKATRRQAKLGVDVMTGTHVTATSPHEVALSSGERVPTRTMISAVGTKPTSLVESLPVAKDERGRIVTDRELRVVGRDRVWAAGDCAAIPDPRGGTCPPVALYALKHGARIGANVGRTLEGKAARPFTYKPIGQGASVGNRYAVGEVKGVEIWGFPAWLVWRLLLLYYFPSWDRRLRLITDWLIWPLVGRDIVELRVDREADYELSQNLFQPDETIAVQGGQSRYIHVIVEGEVELVARGAERGGEVLQRLGPGDNFGIRWVAAAGHQIARAKTTARTIAIRRDQAPRLQEVLDSAGHLVAESGVFPAITDEQETVGPEA